jgi:glycosyltransferase involved in cell wall biosynthesis
MASDNAEQRPTRVLVLIPTLHAGGAEMDVARNLPRIDRTRFKIVVCAFLERGNLAQLLIDAGIEVIGPIPPRASLFLPLRALAKQFLSLTGLRRGLFLVGPRRWRSRAGLRRLLIDSRPLLFLVGPLLAILRPAASAWPYLRLARAIAGHIVEREIDVVHAILPNSYVVAGIATRLARRSALVMSRVSLNWYHEQYPLLGMLERHVLHRIAGVAICNSAAIRKNLLTEGIPLAKIRLIPNGIDVQSFSSSPVDRQAARDRLGIAPDALVFCVVANLHPYKGHADLLHAFRLAAGRLAAGWILLAVGADIDGNLTRMCGLSQDLGLSQHTRFLGPRSDVELILRAADIHVSASHTEGFPNNVLEAMCASLPVVAAAVGGIPEMLVDGQTGLLVPARNPEGMADALVALAHDPGRRKAMGEAGRNLVASSFSLERSVNSLQDVYAEFAAPRRT